MELNRKNMSNTNLEEILSFMSEKPESEKEEFKLFASTPIEKEGEKARLPKFVEIRSYIFNKYYPIEKQNDMLMKIMSL